LEAAATPLALVPAVVLVCPLAKVSEAPLAGAVKVTATPESRLLEASVTLAWMTRQK
jgi:hypothetical protein